jgi:hypothetical protein
MASGQIPINSCASNSKTLETVCTGNDNTVHTVLHASSTNTDSLAGKFTSSGIGKASFSGGKCTNCEVVMDVTHNKALIGLSLSLDGKNRIPIPERKHSSIRNARAVESTLEWY